MSLSYELPSFVVVDGRLTGLLAVPPIPFAWLVFKNKPAQDGDDVQRIVDSTVDVSVGELGRMTALSGELVNLFDTYGIPFSAEVSQQLAYEHEGMLRSFLLMNVEFAPQLLHAFGVLMDTWVSLYSQPEVPKPSLDEIRLLRMLLIQFKLVLPEDYFEAFGWDLNKRFVLPYLFAEPESRLDGLDAGSVAAYESMMEESGYRHFW